jgi:hypothetical protein
MIRKITPKDKMNFFDFCINQKIQNEKVLFNQCLKWGYESYIDDTRGLSGLLLVKKIDKKTNIIIYFNSLKSAKNLLKKYFWTCNSVLYTSLASNSPLLRYLLKVGFRIYSAQNNPTVELIREIYKKPFVKKDK